LLELLANRHKNLQEILLIVLIGAVHRKFYNGTNFFRSIHHENLECFLKLNHFDEDLRRIQRVLYVILVLVAKHVYQRANYK